MISTVGYGGWGIGVGIWILEKRKAYKGIVEGGMYRLWYRGCSIEVVV